MARMIPNYCIAESPGEEKLFKLLRDDALTNDWTILHSLHIAHHVSKNKGEADFVVLIPNMGVVILEIKSHLKILVQDGVWFLGSEKGPHESPFVQAERAMYSIRRNLIDKLSFIRGTPFLSLCWFTSVEFPKNDTFEWKKWQVLNSGDLNNVAISLLESFKLGLEHLRASVSRNIGLNSSFGDVHIQQIIDQLRPNFEFSLSEKVIRSERKKQLINFAQDQYAALDLFSMVPRVIFKGPAGTGKSLLAIELAKRACSEGKNVKLVCFNTLLAKNLRKQFSHINLEISTIDSLGYRIASLDPRLTLPKNPLDALRQINFETISVPDVIKSDLLIVDEAQDTFNEKYLSFLNSLVKGGFTNGNWVAFGDFDAQRIYCDEDNIDFFKAHFGDIPVAPLGKNCRNVVQIGHFAEGVLPNVPKWNSFLRGGDNPDPEMIPIPPNIDMVPLLDEVISRYRAEHFAFDEIVVLSPSEIPNPSDVFSESKYSEKFVEIDNSKSGHISFCTIARFKGLDSSCVIALDLEQLKLWIAKNELLYILFTRATDRLAILANDQARKMLVASIGSGL
jgi:hypothetical protein